MLHIKKIIKINLLFLFLPSIALAQINACNTDVTGKTIKWDSTWSPDNKDNGVIYKITRVTELEQGKVIMLELTGPDSSIKKQRDFLIQNQSTMKEFCKNMDLSLGDISNDAIISDNKEELSQAQLARLPFIKYTKNGWERYPIPANTNLSSCEILGKKFCCSVQDKKAYADKLKELQDEVILMRELGY